MKYLIPLLLIVFALSSCYEEDDYLLSNIEDDFLILSSKDTSILADGSSSSEIIVELPYITKKEYSKVVLKTSRGKFENDKQEIEANVLKVVVDGQDKKIAKAKLSASQSSGTATIEAKIGDFTKSIEIQFEKAYPESIKTILDTLAIGYGYQTITITTKVTRNTGKPSLGTNAKVIAVDPSGNIIGQFLNYSEAVNESGILTNKFSLGTDNCNCQNILVISETYISSNSVIRDTSSLIVN